MLQKPQHADPRRRTAPSSVATKELARANGLAGCKDRVLAALQASQLPDNTEDLPRFDIAELDVGTVLGQGQFGTISEITAFRVQRPSAPPSSTLHDSSGNFSYRFGSDNDSTTSENTSCDDDDEDGEDERLQIRVDYEAKAFLARHALSDDEVRLRYAVKVLSAPKVMGTTAEDCLLQGIADMAMEAHILSNMEHPNIVKIRAHANVEPYNEFYFIVVDRLYDTLDERMAQWDKRLNFKKGPRRRLSIGRAANKDKSKEKAMAEAQVHKEKLQVAYDLADALLYIHKKQMVYRNIQSENVGFDIRNDVRLFDFRLSRELHSSQRDVNGTYNLTQLGVGEGNPKYTSPEVGNGEPYNERCDSYSLGILIWQIMSCQTPYMNCEAPDGKPNLKVFQLKIWNPQAQQRPPLDEKWPLPIRLMLKRSWAHSLHDRSTMQSIHSILQQELVAVNNGEETSLDHVERRSTYVFDRELCMLEQMEEPDFDDAMEKDSVYSNFSDKSEKSLTLDPRDYMANSRQRSDRSIGREERYRRFAEEHSIRQEKVPGEGEELEQYPSEEDEVVEVPMEDNIFWENLGNRMGPGGEPATHEIYHRLMPDEVESSAKKRAEKGTEAKQEEFAACLSKQSSSRSLGKAASRKSRSQRPRSVESDEDSARRRTLVRSRSLGRRTPRRRCTDERRRGDHSGDDEESYRRKTLTRSQSFGGNPESHKHRDHQRKEGSYGSDGKKKKNGSTHKKKKKQKKRGDHTKNPAEDFDDCRLYDSSTQESSGEEDSRPRRAGNRRRPI